MTSIADDLRAAYLSAATLLSYEPETGLLRWKVQRRHLKAGDVAGYQSDGKYVYVTVNARRLAAHRVAWTIMTGEPPTTEIDHINGTMTDNRWANLRQADRLHNCWNIRKYANNTSGYKGVTFSNSNRRWWAKMVVNKKMVLSEMFDTPEEAAAAYEAASRKHRGEFHRDDALRGDSNG